MFIRTIAAGDGGRAANGSGYFHSQPSPRNAEKRMQNFSLAPERSLVKVVFLFCYYDFLFGGTILHTNLGRNIEMLGNKENYKCPS